MVTMCVEQKGYVEYWDPDMWIMDKHAFEAIARNLRIIACFTIK